MLKFASLLDSKEMPRASICQFPLAFSYPPNDPLLFVFSLVALFKVKRIGGSGTNRYLQQPGKWSM